MATLVLINGAPGSGKTTLGRHYAAHHDLALHLDIDEIRAMLGRWEDRRSESGSLARSLAEAMARNHLDGGHDVVITQLIGHIPDLERFEAVARQTRSEFREFVLLPSRAACLERMRVRSGTDLSKAALAEFDRLHQRLLAALAVRPAAVRLEGDHLDASALLGIIEGHRPPRG